MAKRNNTKKSNYRFVAAFFGSILGLAGIAMGVILVLQPQLLNQKAAEVRYTPRPSLAPRILNCKFSQNSDGRLRVVNPVLGQDVFLEMGKRKGCYVGKTRVVKGKVQVCAPMEVNGCGNIGEYIDQVSTFIRFNPAHQGIHCTRDSQCRDVAGNSYTFCDEEIGRCKEDLGIRYCSRITTPGRCNSTYFVDFNQNRRRCKWTISGMPYNLGGSDDDGCYVD